MGGSGDTGNQLLGSPRMGTIPSSQLRSAWDIAGRFADLGGGGTEESEGRLLPSAIQRVMTGVAASAPTPSGSNGTGIEPLGPPTSVGLACHPSLPPTGPSLPEDGDAAVTDADVEMAAEVAAEDRPYQVAEKPVHNGGAGIGSAPHCLLGSPPQAIPGHGTQVGVR